MLILTRRIGEEIVIGADIRVRVVEVRGNQLRIGIAAPHEVPVYREEIYRRIWSEPIQRVAKSYNISDVALGKICTKLRIPRPGRGYWAKKAAGKPLPKQPALSLL